MTLRVLAELTEGFGNRIAHSPRDGLWVSVAAAQFHVWRERDLLFSVPLGGQPGGNPSFSRNGQRLFVGARIFDLASREFTGPPGLDKAPMAGLPPGSNGRPQDFLITGSGWSPDGQVLAVHVEHRPPRDPRVTAQYTGPWKRLLLLDGSSGELIATLIETNRSEEYTSIAIGDDLIAAAGLEVAVWRRSGLERVARLEGFNVSFRDLRLNADGSLMAAAAWDSHVAVWETASWERTGAWNAHEDYARCVAFHPQEALLASGGGDEALKLWSATEAGELRDSLEVGAKVEDVSFRPDGTGLIAALDDGRLLLCEYEA